MNTVKVIDISKHQAHQQKFTNIIDWQKVKAAGVKAVWIKAAEGQTYHDPALLSHVKAISEAGLLMGLYLFFRVGRAADAQADNFAKAYTLSKALAPAHVVLPPMIDLEPVIQVKNGVNIDVDGIGSLPKGLYAQKALHLAGEVAARLGAPLAYTYPAFAKEQGLAASLSTYALWIAHYGVKRPIIPKGWAAPAIWQYSGSGKLAGVPTAVDLNEVYLDTLSLTHPAAAALLRAA